jgi:aspartate kinase
VALACYLNADKCEIYTDVDGVYTADPRIVKEPKLLKEVSSDIMLNLCYNGSKVLHSRAVEFACKYGVQVEIKSSFTFAPGTMIKTEKIENNKEDKMEERVVTAIAHKDNLTRYSIAYTEQMQEALTDWHLEVFKYHLDRGVLELFAETKYVTEIDYVLESKGIKGFSKDYDLCFVSLTGLGLGYDPAFLGKCMEVCTPFKVMRTICTEKSVELLMPAAWVKEAVYALHKAFVKDK